MDQIDIFGLLIAFIMLAPVAVQLINSYMMYDDEDEEK